MADILGMDTVFFNKRQREDDLYAFFVCFFASGTPYEGLRLFPSWPKSLELDRKRRSYKTIYDL